ncbi:MAG: LOG family protein [Candidatus Latescibacteria bacterium]|jgi:uncharacterized protein (TIGR00730 family)|nr:LOG family protein [Candidatus Latescibacterota bacterium]
MENKKKIAVFGSSRPQPDNERYKEAYSLGHAIASEGWTVVTGGYRGVMEAASRGAKEAGGNTIGITSAFFENKNIKPNDFVDTEIKTPTYAERLLKLTGISDGYVIMRGGSGTLTELFFSWELEKNKSIPSRPLVLFGKQWKRIIDFLAEELADELSFSSYLHLLKYSDDTDEVIALIREGLENI